MKQAFEFKGPAKLAVYGGKDGQWARITGCDTVNRAKELIALHTKTYPGCEYRIYECTWKEIKHD
jgi:hypothetical protein